MERMNQWMTLIANIGVLAGIVFVALEIQANTNAVRSATYQAFNDSSFSWADSQIENAAELAEIYKHSSREELTPEQRLIVDGVTFKAFTIMESNYLHHRAGAMDDDLFETKMRGSVGALLNIKLWMEGWKQRELRTTPEFWNYMEAKIKVAQSVASNPASS
ncbi:MAG: hypothetical protein OES38_02780 [Gammaproteobacteria bacterium]|nr:hypothetical protein [Gammaproteobacteria bacterium]